MTQQKKAVADDIIVCVKKKSSKMSRTVLFWGDRLDDDITKLPKEWEARVSENDRVYFVK